MRKKSHPKRRRKGWTRKRPDEVWTNGPLRVEQSGNFIRLLNTSTPEQHAAFLDKANITFQEVFVELEREVVGLQALVGKYDPIDIMHRAAYEIMPLLMKNRSEYEFFGEEAYTLPTVEYLQYLIARTEPNSDGRATAEAEWKSLWAQAVQVLELMHLYLMFRKTRTPPSEIDELRLILDSRRLGVRVKRYPFFQSAHWRSAFLPYEQEIKAAYGIGVDELIHGFQNIDQHQVVGVPNRYRAVFDATSTLMNQLREKGFAVGPGASPEEQERTEVAILSSEFQALHEEMRERMRLTFTPALFDITDISGLPRSILSLLAVRSGESVLTTLTGPDHDDLSPLSTSALHYKPFLQYRDRFYIFYHSGFEDHMGDIVEADLFERFPLQIPVMMRRRSDRLELDTKDLFLSVTRPDFAHLNVYYHNPDDEGNLTELDILLGIDDVLFLVEAKAGSFSAGAKRGAPESMAKEFSALILEGQRQSERAERYIRSAGEVAFFDSTGKNEIQRIRGSQFRRIFRVIVTREDLGWVGARIASLSILDPHLSRSYPWHVSIDDLRVVAELFRNDEIRFVHYLEQRLSASAEVSLTQSDELEHIGLYNSQNVYHQLPKGVDRLSYDASYMLDIDHYFVDKYLGESPPLPTQRMPPKVRLFVDALRLSGISHRFEMGSLILSMGTHGREALEKALKAADAGRYEGKQRSTRMLFIEQKTGLTISYAAGPNWDEELRNCAIQMEQSSCNQWFAVQLADTSPYKITIIEIIVSGRFKEAELASAKIRHNLKVQRMIGVEKPGRNDPCPCMSGKKFKRCHGK